MTDILCIKITEVVIAEKNKQRTKHTLYTDTYGFRHQHTKGGTKDW